MKLDEISLHVAKTIQKICKDLKSLQWNAAELEACYKTYIYLQKIGFDTAEVEPQKEPSTRPFLPSRAEPSARLTRPAAGLCAARKQGWLTGAEQMSTLWNGFSLSAPRTALE